ncbi:MAG: hypothetical protein ACTHZ7_13245 [Sphingobacterium sp.]
MENQIENSNPMNVKRIILLAGSILGALTAWLACETFLGVIGGLIGGFVFAIIFVTALLPHKPHDR